MTEPHNGPWVETPWKPGTLLVREENGVRYFGQVIPADTFGIATLEGLRVQSVATQSDALRYGWQPWIAVRPEDTDTDLIVPASVVSKVARTALTLQDQRTVMERTVERQRHNIEAAQQELRDFKRALVREIRDSVDDESEDDQGAAYAMLRRLGLEVTQRHTVRVTLSATIDMAPGETLGEDDVTTAIKDDDFDMVNYTTTETEWVVDF